MLKFIEKQLAEGDFYIGSADWMCRNLTKRIGIVRPVRASVLKQRPAECLDIFLNDTRQGWQLNSDASYQRIDPHSAQIETHRQLMDAQATAI